ncbi:MAG: DNA polymerase Y family protein [Myxococcota bacterium]|nr:hypothetical protein [Deltaproteobacteria bacterium]MDP6243988.1 DNA polymerase Y family protein [Myxococcota bacterium]MDP7075783.1 DNA polymerase Y family protein [Myxococcota bacterium]MDP7433832.1 DNA polymerase Y family protein [Myxococcota bacterium]
MRVACCRVPNLPLAAALRAHPEFAGAPLAIASGPDARAEVVAVSPEAERRGVRCHTTLAHARSVCGALHVRVASPALEGAARQALLDAALGSAPRAELAPRLSGPWGAEACAFVDAAGVEALHASETGFASALVARAGKLGLPACAAVASGRAVARLAARRAAAGEVHVLTPHKESTFLAALPLEIFDPDDATLEKLTRFGVRSTRDLLRLPRRALATRLGPRVLELIALARGALREMPLAPAPEGRLVEAADLEFAVDRIEPLVFVLGGLLSRLLARLEARHLACSALQLRLTLETGGRDARRVGLAAPTLDRRVLVRLLTQALESSPPAAAVESAALEAERSPLRADQLDLFRPAGPAPNALGRVVAGLQALCGEGRIGSPAVADDHRPERFEITSPGASLACKVRKTRAAHETPRLATRALRPPVAAQVQLRGSHPVQVRSALAHGAVVHAAGPWRTTGGWWSPETRWAYDHFDVLTSDGILSRLRFDHVRRAWHIDAIYD